MSSSIGITIRDSNENAVICATLSSETYDITILNKEIMCVQHVLTLRQALQGVVGTSDSWVEIELDILGILEKAVDYYSLTKTMDYYPIT